MASPLDVSCPTCSARPGERCDRGPTHDDRRTAWLDANRKTTIRETRYYDLDPTDMPAGHDDLPPLLSYRQPISDDNRARGIRAIEAFRAAHTLPPRKPSRQP